ncbi:hypothetical protein I546_5832 [Mycobacterium kansasii 732]|nr:hypothetical protein I546_5832 [Mycobacterium kansasii 732]
MEPTARELAARVDKVEWVEPAACWRPAVRRRGRGGRSGGVGGTGVVGGEGGLGGPVVTAVPVAAVR